MYQVEILRENAWRPVSRPRTFQRASELRQTIAKIKPEMITRSRCLSPELFPL